MNTNQCALSLCSIKVGGLLVALAILYAGAIGKVVATSAAIPLTVLSEAILVAHSAPSLVQSMLAGSVMNAVLMFGMLAAKE